MNKLSVDFHTHILHGIDDGSSSLTQSLKMLKAEYNMGIETVVATPHFYADMDTPEEFILRRQAAFEEIQEHNKNDSETPRIILGAEVLYFDGIENWDTLDSLAIEGTRYILIEIPHTSFTVKRLNALALFKEKTGYTPIIAHLDRYITAFRTFNLPEILSQMDVLVQMNASSFLRFPDSFRAIKLLKNDKAHLLGSDCHNLTTRIPNLDKAQEVILKKAGEQTINRLIEFQNLILGNGI